jgi:hypothetical protein
MVAARDGATQALALAETLALAAPTLARLWDLAAEQAEAAGRPDWAVALGTLALALSLDRPKAHQRLARWHGAAGDPVAEAFRHMTARRLTAAQTR